MYNGDKFIGRDDLTPEQEARVATHQQNVYNYVKTPENKSEIKPNLENLKIEQKRNMEIIKNKEATKQTIVHDWLEMHPTFSKNDKTTMIPKGKQIAILVSNNVSIVTTNQVLYFPNFYLGNEIVAVERSGGRKTKRRRSRKRKSKQN